MKGLSQRAKSLPCKYFYDDRGSRLFDQICDLDEYYVTRTEISILERFADEIGHCLPSRSAVLEPGSGSSIKTRLLLDHAKHLSSYVPVDISREHLERAAQRLAAAYPHLAVLPVCADFTQEFDLPAQLTDEVPVTVFFPGSTIGNFEPADARRLLARLAGMVHRGGGLLIGVDLQKPRTVLEAAYDDSQGITSEFNLNLLSRINRELDADFNIDSFQHSARYNELLGRIEIYLVSLCDQQVTIADRQFAFTSGEEICTEYSHKFTVDGFVELARTAGWQFDRVWTDPREWFAVLHFCLP